MQTKEQKIRTELDRLSILFEDLDENKRELLDSVLQNAAFMKVTLDELQEEIAKTGAVERYQNGANQYGLKQSAAVQAYNALVKNYTAIMKVLGERLPYKTKPTVSKMTRLQSEIEEIKEEDVTEMRKRLYNGFASYDEYLQDFNDRKARGELTPEELELEREVEENRRVFQENEKLMETIKKKASSN